MTHSTSTLKNNSEKKLRTNDLELLGVDKSQRQARDNAKRILKNFVITFDRQSYNTLLEGLDGRTVGDLGTLEHGQGNNFNVCLLCPELVHGVTHLWVLENKDNRSQSPVLKFPGGGSWPNENIIQTAVAEMNEEFGRFPRRLSLLKYKVIPSKEEKLKELDYERGWNHFKLALVARSTMGTALKYESKDKENSVARQVSFKELLVNPNLNYGHKSYLEEFLKWVPYDEEMGVKFPDVVKFVKG